MPAPSTTTSIRLQEKPEAYAQEYVPGHVIFPGTPGNSISRGGAGLPADASVDWRVETERPAIPLPAPLAVSRVSNFPTYLDFSSTGVLVFVFASDGTFPSLGVTYGAMVGFPAVGEKVQLRATWDATTDTMSLYWRASGTDLSDDTGWTFANSTVHAGKQINTIAGWFLSGNAFNDAVYGKTYRWYRKVNGVLETDVNPTTDVSNELATSFTATTGQTVTVFRASRVEYLDFPGTTGNYCSVPDAAALDIVGDICIFARIAPDDWTPATDMTIVGKWTNTGNQRSYRLDLRTDGRLELRWSTTGSDGPTHTSSVAVGAADGTYKWVAVSFDVDDGAGGRDARFWTSDDALTWTQLGTTQHAAATTSIFASTAILEIGSHTVGTTLPFAGNVSHASIRSGIGAGGTLGGTEVFKFNQTSTATSEAATTINSTTGQVITVNRSGSPSTSIVLQVPGDTTTLVAEMDAVRSGVPVGVGDWYLVVEQLMDSGDLWGIGEWGEAEWGTVEWLDITADIRGMEWTRGSDAPFGRPRNGTINITLDANSFEMSNEATPSVVRKYNPWQEYTRTRPGNIIRAGLVSVTDTRPGNPTYGFEEGWLPLWAGLTDSWVCDSQDGVDYFATVELVESASALSRIDQNAGSSQGANELITPRIERLLTAANWQYGFIRRSWAEFDQPIPYQATDLSKPRLDECYLTADSGPYIFRSDTTGAALLTDSQFASNVTPTRLGAFSGTAPQGAIRFRPESEDFSLTTKRIVFDIDSLIIAQDPEHIINDHRYARVGGTQQVVQNEVSIGRFGRFTRARSDLLSTADLYALGVAQDDDAKESISSIRVDSVTITSTGKPDYYLLVAAIDIGNECAVEIDLAEDVRVAGPIRSMTHSILPMRGQLEWHTTYALDTRSLTNFPTGAVLPAAP